MSSRVLALASFVVFTYGCAHSYEVAKTDMPEDDTVIAAAPHSQPAIQAAAAPKPINVIKQVVEVEATPEPVAAATPVTVEANRQPASDEATSTTDTEIQQAADKIQSEEADKSTATAAATGAAETNSPIEHKECRSVTFAKKYLKANHVKTPARVGDAKDSVPNWKKGGFKVVKISPLKNQGKPFDICVYDNDQAGDIFVKKTDGKWVNGCGAAPSREPASNKLLACLRKGK